MPRLGLFDSFENHYYSRFPMTAEHNEFPPLEYAARRILESADTREENIIGNTWLRSFAAVVIREAVKLVPLSVGPGSMQLIRVADLLDIADNLHALPPPPPTREEMEIALGRLLRHTDDPAGCHEGSLIAELANVLRRGITHYCSPTP